MAIDENLKQVRDRLYSCRDLEISNLWQRSIFLSVFLVLCFTGYGFLLVQIADNLESEKIIYLHFFAFILGIVSLLFSILWTMMAKGSKAWYEVYETAISKFEYDYYDQIGLPYDNIMGEMGLEADKVNSNLFSSKAGAYSVSKINILIGQICMTLWGMIIIIHSIILFFNELMNFYPNPDCVIISVVILLWIIIVVIFWYFINRSKQRKKIRKEYNEYVNSLKKKNLEGLNIEIENTSISVLPDNESEALRRELLANRWGKITNINNAEVNKIESLFRSNAISDIVIKRQNQN